MGTNTAYSITPHDEVREVSTEATIQIGRLEAEIDGRWLVSQDKTRTVVPADEAVDPRLLQETAKCGGLVLLLCENLRKGVPRIVGVVQTQRAVTIDRQGNVDLSVRKLRITAEEEATIRTQDAYLRLRAAKVELYGRKVLTRARETVRILGRLVSLQ